MTESSTPRQQALLGDDEAASIAEALLANPRTTVSELADSFDSDPNNRRSRIDLDEVVRNSVFGRPEPQSGTSGAPGHTSVATGAVGRTSPLAPGSSGSIVRQSPTASNGGASSAAGGAISVATIARVGVEEDARRRKITLVLAALFGAALLASASVTFLGIGSTVGANDEGEPTPTVSGVTQTQPSTSLPTTALEPTTVVAPPTTAVATAPTTTTPPTSATTTEAPTTEAPTTTLTPTTVPATAAPNTAAPTTRRPTTTRPPTTELTIPDVTFSQPTWVPTDPEPAEPVEPADPPAAGDG